MSQISRKGSYRDYVFVVGSEGDTVDAILVTRELSDTAPVLDVPDSDGGKVATFAGHQVSTILGPEAI